MAAQAFCGVGLRPPHMVEFLGGFAGEVADFDCPDFLEIHAENFIDLASPRALALLEIREHYPLSCHSVGLSLGSADGVCAVHLGKIKALVDVIEPILFSEHVAWSCAGGCYLNDLLPLPLTEEALGVMCENIDKVQSALGRRILVENPSSYVAFVADEMSESEFMCSLVERSGCGLLLDLNNLYVASENHGFSVADYLRSLPTDAIGEIHLAGHVVDALGGAGESLRIDTHSRPVADAVWRLYSDFMAGFTSDKPLPVLIEWDLQLPPLSVLLEQQQKARRLARLA